MKIKSSLAALLLLLTISCRKEKTIIQSSSINGEGKSSEQQATTDATELNENVIKIGSQIWMKKNLTISRYRNGDRIPQVKDGAEWAALTTGAWCWYNNDSAKGTVYGKLYNWYAVNDPRGLAPAGWHIPNNEEWTILTTFLGGTTIAGAKMKETGTTHWLPPNPATNRSGFTALPGGYRVYSGEFTDIGVFGFWWSATEDYGYYGGVYQLFYDNRHFLHYSGTKQNGYSVRFIKDSLP